MTARHVDVSDYVDGALTLFARRAAERHLVCCEVCRYEVEQERRIRSALRAPAPPPAPAQLRDALLSMATLAPASAQWPEPARLAPAPLPIVPRYAPARHRSGLRTVLIASLAAGGCAAAVVGVATTSRGTMPTDSDGSPAMIRPVEPVTIRPGRTPAVEPAGVTVRDERRETPTGPASGMPVPDNFGTFLGVRLGGATLRPTPSNTAR